MNSARMQPVDNDTFVEIQRFLFGEAALLDNRQYADWLGLLDEDIHYRVMVSVVRDAGADSADYAIIEEYLVGLKSRIDQISNPRLTRAENRRPSPAVSYRTSKPTRPTRRKNSRRCLMSSPTAPVATFQRAVSTSRSGRTFCAGPTPGGGWRADWCASTSRPCSTAR
jgi:Ring hydroxylating beta subunit